LRIARRKVLADIASAAGAEDGINNRVESDVRVAVTRETARAGARGDSEAAAIARGRQVAPGAVVTLSDREGQVVATASDTVEPPGGLLGFLPAAHVRAEAVAVAEGAP